MHFFFFMTTGTLIYLNSPESPLTCVPKFKVATTATTTGFQSGRYQLSEDEVSLYMYKYYLFLIDSALLASR